MAYEIYKKQRRPAKDQPMITVLKGGHFGVNRACYEEYFKNFKYAVLFYDVQLEKIGLRPTNEMSDEACTVRPLKSGTLGHISAIGFLKHFGIEHKESRSYAATWNDQEKLVEVSLK